MTGAYRPYAPLGVPKPVAAELWIVDGPEIRMRYLGIGVPFPTRMTIVRLADGGLWIHSPVEGGDGLFDAVERIGPVAHIVAPNSIHYWWMPEWHRRFPAARLHAIGGLAQTARRPLPAMETLTATPDPAWTGTIDQVIVPGSAFSEADFFHRPSRTLILTDLIENFDPARVRSRVWRAVLRASGAADPDGKAPYDMQLSFWRHRGAVRAAVRTMIGWQPERIILAHGRCYDRNGVEELRRAFRWVL